MASEDVRIVVKMSQLKEITLDDIKGYNEQQLFTFIEDKTSEKAADAFFSKSTNILCMKF